MLLKVITEQKFWKEKNIIIPAGIIVTLLLAVTVWGMSLLASSKIYKGIFIENLNISGLSASQAQILLNSHLKALYGNGFITVKYGEQAWNIGMEDISFRFSTDDTLKMAYEMGRTGNVFRRIYSILDLSIKEINLTVSPVFDRNRLQAILESIKGETDKSIKDASVLYKNSKVVINKETWGHSLNVEGSIKAIENEIALRNFKNINLEVEDIRPTVVFDDIKDMNEVLASATTTFNAQDINRTANIKLACERINGTILKPGDVFSMNKALGPRTIENGYKDAKVIYLNEFIDGPGGGVCQVTTTLYVSILKVRTKVVERMHHSLPLGYVQPGQDATIAENYIDFKFKNTKDYPIALSAEAIGSNLNIRILGKKDAEEYTVKLRSTVVEEYIPEAEEVLIDNSMSDYEKRITREAKKGMRVLVYREVYNKNGQMIEKEKISDDEYKPVRGQVKVNQNYYNTYYNRVQT